MTRADKQAVPGKARQQREQAQQRRRRQVLIGAAVVGSLLLAALLTQPLLPGAYGGYVGRIPRPGDISVRDYKAPAAVTIVDREATEALRRSAMDRAPVVYDFDERRASTLVESLGAAFRAAREAAGRGAEGDEAALSPEAAFVSALGDTYRVPDEVVADLAARGFASEDERLLARLVEPVVRRMITADHPELESRLDKRIVVVRELGSEAEQRLKSADGVLTLEAAREAIGAKVPFGWQDLEQPRRDALLALGRTLVRSNLDYNLRASDERRQAAVDGVKEATISLREGEIIVRDGDPITERHVLILRGIRDSERQTSRFELFVGVAGLLLLTFVMAWRFGAHSFRKFAAEPRDAVFMVSVLVASALGTDVALFLADAVAGNPTFAPLVERAPGVLYFGIPIATGAMLVRLVHNAETALVFSIVLALAAGLQVRGDLDYAFFALVGALVATLGAARVRQRGTLLRAGLRVGLANVVTVAALTLLGGEPEPIALLLGCALGLFSGAMSGVLTSGLAPIVESLFAYTTDIKLLELANREHSLLRELELRAPGTYHHSMMVGHLAEKAADAIGANALEAKVAGYYHDIGKMRRPHFFVENVTIHQGHNRHEKLAPSMSARIIQAHVKDGADLGAKHKLADPILRGIRQHHGTSIIRFFYEKAKEMVDPEKGEEVREHDYRYGGPKPQTREAGILMLADSVEAASRTLPDTSPARVQQLVQRIINNYFRDGQLDECSLTLRDLHAIARTFIDTLCAIRHERIDYPEATDEKGRRLEDLDEGLGERDEPKPEDRSQRAKEDRDDDLRRLGLP